MKQRHRLAQAMRRVQHGEELHKAGNIPAAVQIYREVLAEHPNHVGAIYLSGIAAYQEREYRMAELLFQRTIAMAPKFADAYYNLGLTLQEMGRMADALFCYAVTLDLNPDSAPAWVNSGTALLAVGQPDAAIEHLTRSMACTTPAPENRLNRAIANVLTGRWIEGWQDWEHRWDAPSFRTEYTRILGQPQWDGKSTNDPLLVWAEQGFGDTLMMLRYVPIVEALAPDLTLEVQPALVRLVQRALPGITVVAKGDVLPAFRAHLPMMSLPYVFGTTPDTVPTYQLPIQWSTTDDRLRVGLCWAGTVNHRNDARRSIPLSSFAPLFDLPVNWQALQLERLGGIEDTPVRPLVLPQDPDFEDTAAVVGTCDLVLTVDTSIAHLAGVMGKPTLLLVSAWPDFRWMLKTERTPWYPSMRLYRQARVGDWMQVIMRVQHDLRALLGAAT